MEVKIKMYGVLLFKNARGTTKLNVVLEKNIDGLADISNNIANIINYLTRENDYNFTLSNTIDTSSATLNETSFNSEFLEEYYKTSHTTTK